MTTGSGKRQLYGGRLVLWMGLLISCLVPAACNQPARPTNILLISIDTLRADHLASYGREGDFTPVIDNLARRGMRLENAFTPVPITLPAHATMMTGLNPNRHGVRNNSFYELSPHHTTLAERFRAEGFRTGAVVAAAVLDGRFGLDQGFESYDDQIGERTQDVLIAERRAVAVTDRATQWLEDLEPADVFFLWVHYFDPHDPYSPPEPFASRFPNDPYLGEIAYVDTQIGHLLGMLSSRDSLANTLVVLVGDHGESLGEHGENTHGIFLYDSTLRVPMILAGPGVDSVSFQQPDHPVSLTDLLPTVLGRMSLPADQLQLDGVDLFSQESARDVVYAETLLPRDFYNWSGSRALRSLQHKYIQAPQPEWFDLISDPAEAQNLAAQKGQQVNQMSEILRTRFPEPIADSQAFPDQELLKRIQSLGYLGGRSSAPADDPLPDPKERIHLVSQIDDALALQSRGDHQQAVARLRGVLRQDARNFLAAHTLADSLFELKAYQEAVAVYQLTLDLGREEGFYHYRLGLSFEAVGDVKKAAAHFEKLLQLEPEAAEEILQRADQLASAGQLSAAALYHQAVQNSGVSGAGLQIRQLELLLLQGNEEEALKQVRRAVPADSGDEDLRRIEAVALRRLGARKGESGDLRGALDFLKSSVSIDPDNFEGWANLGMTHLRLNQSKEALHALLKAISLSDSDPRILNLAAELLFRQGERAEARRMLQRSLQIDPDQPRIKKALAELN